jgi:uncharacterized protein (UPF0276 family)
MIARDDRVSVLAAGAGIGLRPPHVAQMIASRPAVAFLEVHPENYMGGGPAIAALEGLRRDYPLSLHGVGLSLGGSSPLDAGHLARLARLVERLDPVFVSEHLAWSVANGTYFNHLLPLPYVPESLDAMCARVSRMQDALGREVLVENPSLYLRFRHSCIPEPVFLGELARRSGCRILLDVNNLYVSCRNLDDDPVTYLDALPAEAIGEIHLGGHTANDADGRTMLIDDHGSRVAEPVWQLYERALERYGPVPTLIEWDRNLPELAVLLDEAAGAQRHMDAVRQRARDVIAA